MRYCSSLNKGAKLEIAAKLMLINAKTNLFEDIPSELRLRTYIFVCKSALPTLKCTALKRASTITWKLDSTTITINPSMTQLIINSKGA